MAKVWKVPGKITAHLPIESNPYQPNNTFYSLYKKTGRNSYTRVSIFSYTNPRIADNVFRGSIQSNPLEYSIRLVKSGDIPSHQANIRFGV